MHLIVGLGNPDAQYAGHRHNVGFMAIDAIARRHGFAAFRSKFQGLIGDGTIEGQRTLLFRPQTFMNRSGDAVAAVTRFYKLTPEDVTVIYDEIDLAPGKVRIKTGGSNGGHNGLRSIDPQIGTGYQRVRIGIGHPGHKGAVSAHVLSNFHKSDLVWLEPLLDTLADNAGLLLSGDQPGLMNKLALAKGASVKAPARPAQIRKKPAHRPVPPGETPPADPKPGPMAAMLKKLFGKD